MWPEALEERISTVCKEVQIIETENVKLSDSAGRIIAQEVIATGDIPPFDRTPYDGYALRSDDVKNASKENPVVLKVLEEIPAGGISHFPVNKGTAVRIMTGAPMPKGADCVIMYEKTEFTDTEVKIFDTVKAGENVVFAGEDTKKGTVLAKKGTIIDAGLMGTMAGQNIAKPIVYKIPKIGIITTGSELVEVGEELPKGKIHDSNAYTLNGTLKRMGCIPVMYGIVKDDPDLISDKIKEAVKECDAVLLTGGVSVGDFDYTPAAIEKAGGRILFRGAPLKPGMACAYAVLDGKLICALSGNPTSSIVNFLIIARPAILKMAGNAEFETQMFKLILKGSFRKKSKGMRLLHGKLDISDGTVRMDLSSEQGNVIVSSTIGCECMAVVPAGSGPLEPGTELMGFRI